MPKTLITDHFSLPVSSIIFYSSQISNISHNNCSSSSLTQTSHYLSFAAVCMVHTRTSFCFSLRNKAWSHLKSILYILVPIKSGENSHCYSIYWSILFTFFLVIIIFTREIHLADRDNSMTTSPVCSSLMEMYIPYFTPLTYQ